MRFPVGVKELSYSYLVDVTALGSWTPAYSAAYEPSSTEIIVFCGIQHASSGVIDPPKITSVSQTGATWTFHSRSVNGRYNIEIWYKLADAQNTNSVTLNMSYASSSSYVQASHICLYEQSRTSKPLVVDYSTSSGTTTTFPAHTYSGSEFSRLSVMIAYRTTISGGAGTTAAYPWSRDAAITGSYYTVRVGVKQKDSGGFPVSGHIYGTWELIYMMPGYSESTLTSIPAGALNYYNKDSNQTAYNTDAYCGGVLIPNIVQPNGMML